MSVFEPKFQNPITIRLGEKSYIVADERNPQDTSIEEKKSIFLGVHYGLVIITDEGQKIKYATQRRIDEVAMENGYLIVLEEGKSIPWKINLEGNVITRAKFDIEKDVRYVTKSLNLKKKDILRLNAYEPFVESQDYLIEPKISNPVVIFMNDDLKIRHPFSNIEPTIITREDEEEFEIYSTRDSGLYGFKVISSRASITFPTQCPIQTVLYDSCQQIRGGYVLIHEQGKFHPWKITRDMKVIDFAHFNDFRGPDIRYLKDNFDIDRKDIEKVNAYGLKYKTKRI